jgi:hypothetical protein
MRRSQAAIDIGHDIAKQRVEFRNRITGWDDSDLSHAALRYAAERESHPDAYRFYTVRIRAIFNEMITRWCN